MMKSLIDIYDASGKVTTMELLFSFKNNEINYIIYKEPNKEQLYAAKYIKNINEDFDSNLSESELQLCNKIYEEVLNENKK